MYANFQDELDTYNERIGEFVGWIVGIVLLVFAIVWLIKRARKK